MSVERNIAIWEPLNECLYTRARDMVYVATHVWASVIGVLSACRVISYTLFAHKY